MSGCTQVCNQGRDCTCGQPKEDCAAKVTRIKASTPANEVGNIWFAEPEPAEPLTGGEMALVWGMVLAFSLIGWVLMAMGAGYVWTRWLA